MLDGEEEEEEEEDEEEWRKTWLLWSGVECDFYEMVYSYSLQIGNVISSRMHCIYAVVSMELCACVL